MKRVPGHVRSEILAKALLLQWANADLTRPAAEALAAREVFERREREGQRHKPAAPSGAASGEVTRANAGHALFRRVVGMIERIHKPAPEPIEPAPQLAEFEQPSEQPSEPPAPSLLERVGDRVLALLGEKPASEPQPRYAITGDGRTVPLIDEREFPPGLRDQTTANWRASVERNVVEFPSKRGTPKLRSSWIIG